MKRIFIIIISVIAFFALFGGYIAHQLCYSQKYLVRQYRWMYRMQFPCVMDKKYGGCSILSNTERLAKKRGSFIARYRSLPLEVKIDSIQYHIPGMSGFLEFFQDLSSTNDSLVNRPDLFVLTLKSGIGKKQWRIGNDSFHGGFPFFTKGTRLLDTEINFQKDTNFVPVYVENNQIGTMIVVKDYE